MKKKDKGTIRALNMIATITGLTFIVSWFIAIWMWDVKWFFTGLFCVALSQAWFWKADELEKGTRGGRHEI